MTWVACLAIACIMPFQTTAAALRNNTRCAGSRVTVRVLEALSGPHVKLLLLNAYDGAQELPSRYRLVHSSPFEQLNLRHRDALAYTGSWSSRVRLRRASDFWCVQHQQKPLHCWQMPMAFPAPCPRLFQYSPAAEPDAVACELISQLSLEYLACLCQALRAYYPSI